MLTKIKLENFRRFEDHEVPLGPLTVIVGPNNAGKSTIVEGLRLLALVANRLAGLPFRPTPDWLEVPAAAWCVTPSLRAMDLELDRYAFHQLGEPPASITGTFGTGARITVYVGPDSQVCAVIRDASGAAIATKRDARAIGVTRIAIQPQVAPLLRNEDPRDRDYVFESLDTGLSSRHFRNQVWYLRRDYFRAFRALAEENWSGLAINEPEIDNGRVLLLVRDGAFTGDVGYMGHGLQMWLQLMWFLTRARNEPTVVLDEPDVYMHADLQRRLIKMLRGRHDQIVVATHSAEIIGDVEPNEIVVVSAQTRRSKPAASESEVQEVIDELGTTSNLPLTRLWHSRRCLFVEGQDLALLRRFHEVLFPGSDSLDTSPVLPIGGWTGWAHIPKLSEFVRKTVGREVRIYCLLDSDFHWPDEITERQDEARDLGIELLILGRKELENYVLSPPAIARLIAARVGKGKAAPSSDDIERQLRQIVNRLRRQVVGGFSDSYADWRRRHVATSTAMKHAEAHVKGRWAKDGGLALVPGKEKALSSLSGWSQRTYGVSLSAHAIAGCLEPEEIPADLAEFLRAFERTRPLSP